MTTIIYDGKTLYADKRATHISEQHQQTCGHCNKITKRTTLCDKIDIILGGKFLGDDTLAIALAGGAKLGDSFTQAVRFGIEPEHWLQSIKKLLTSDEYWKSNGVDGILICKDRVWDIVLRNGKFTFETVEGPRYYGSGRVGAQVAIEQYGASPLQAMLVVSKYDRGTGDGVDMWSPGQKRVTHTPFDEIILSKKPVKRRKP